MIIGGNALMSNSFSRFTNKMKLLDPRKIIKVSLPSFENVEVDLYDSLLTEQLGEIGSDLTDYERGIRTLQFLIKSWPFTDDKEQPLTITKENLGKLPVKDFTAMMEAVTKSMDFLGKEKTKK